MKWISLAALLAAAACAHGPARAPDAPPDALLSWANAYPLAANELCLWERHNPRDSLRVLQWIQDNPVKAANALQFAAMSRPGIGPRPDSGWRGHVALPGDPAIDTLLDWAARHPDAAQQLDPAALEWTAAHHGC
jgi:hypothetical protein